MLLSRTKEIFQRLHEFRRIKTSQDYLKIAIEICERMFVNIFVYCRWWCSFQWKPFLGGFSSFFCWCLQPWAILCGSNWIRYLFMKSKDQQSLDWESFMKYWECLEFRHDLFPSSSNFQKFSCFYNKTTNKYSQKAIKSSLLGHHHVAQHCWEPSERENFMQI